jgi:hypothetical protein
MAGGGDQFPVGEAAWCDANWPAIARAEAIRTPANPQPNGVPAYCQARPGASADKALRRFMARCSGACKSLAGRRGDTASTAAAYLTPALLAAAAAAFAASASDRQDQPASP